MMATYESRVTAVMITYNRREEVLRSLEKISSLPEQPPIVLVDNGSSDGTFDAVGARFPHVERLRGSKNLGAAARNLGVGRARTPYVALCDDDTWWAAGSLTRAADLLDAFPHAAVLTARLLNGPEEIEDDICRTLAASPVKASQPLPGKAILGFLAGASVVRREAFLEAGGFDSRFFIGGEEELLTIELAVRGWALCYVPELVVHHYPSPRRNSKLRNFHVERNRLWVAWLRRPALRAWRRTMAALRTAATDWRNAACLLGALAGLPWILRERRVVPADLEEQLALLETIC
jgi:GT2 family glycosyltransferase